MTSQSKTRRLGILLFDEVEVLDVAGPFEVFSLAGLHQSPKPFQVVTLAEKTPVRARNGLVIIPDYHLSQVPSLDILLLPGGPGSRQEIHNDSLIQWLQNRVPQTELVLSVCTGVFFLAKAGLVEGMPLTTHHLAFEELKNLAPQNTLLRDQRVVDNGRVIMSGGISAGIDMSLYVLAKLLGENVARETADQMEYLWKSD